MTKVTEIPVYCWHCSKRFYIEIANVTAGRLFCSDECRIENLKEEMELEKERREGKTNGRKISQINQRE